MSYTKYQQFASNCFRKESLFKETSSFPPPSSHPSVCSSQAQVSAETRPQNPQVSKLGQL